ncbi:uncharacterized protein LOC116266222 isoform X2 [Nymphaea colorata]|uniref:uncharacterized protein LOC116266222 isoform X2 n=1 Tax=Nymphaea colorata TaxID=210225 RepID=UPI00129D3A6F|nr:uncharacterized protein LOC116266222 isoform X2 [Nymphaea colorata]
MANDGEKREGREEDERFKTFTPIIPRLERLDYLMRRLEEKQKQRQTQQRGSRGERERESSTQSSRAHHQRTLSSAVQEVQQKGSLLDRIASLENRLLQLSVDMEVSSSSSSSSTVHMSGWSSRELGQERRNTACAISPSYRAKKNSGQRKTGTGNPKPKKSHVERETQFSSKNSWQSP